MPTEIGLVDGTKLVLTDDSQRPDDVLQKIAGHDRFLQFQTTDGDYRVNPALITYIRWVDATPGFKGGAT